MRAYAVVIIALATAFSGCRAERPLDDAILGRWVNVDEGSDTLELREDGSFQIKGPRKRDSIRGTYKFIDKDNVEMKFRIANGEAWHPQWMPPGLLRDPLLRAHVRCTGKTLELRPRGRIRADSFDQFVEFPTIRYELAPAIDEE
jgi:hypothetical protein